MPTHPLDCLEPSDRPLLNLVFDRVDDGMLTEIAVRDYGHDVKVHLAALHQIKAYNIPVPLPWHPGEVLCLTRWSEWDSIAQDSAISTRNHWMRLFACTVLICASLEPENYEYQSEYWNHIEGENSTIIQLIDSALHLGNDASIAAVKFLSWRMQCQIQRALVNEDFGSCPCYAVALLLLCISLDRREPEVVSFLISMAYCNSEYISISREIDGQLLYKWRDQIDRILLNPITASYVQSHPDLQKLAMELIGSSGKK